MISLGRLMTNTPIPISGSLKFYQPSVGDVLTMGEEVYWGLLKAWCLSREEMIPSETEFTQKMTDFKLWEMFIWTSPEFRLRIQESVDCFLHTKIEFLLASHTIMIGETDSSTFLDESLYLAIREICESVSELGVEAKKDDQYKETKEMSAREKELIAKLKNREAQLNKIKNEGQADGVGDRLIKQIISLVAIGNYTFEEVYKMTIIQIVYLLRKYVDIQQYELYTALSPYMDSKKSQGVKHWLDT